jgi:3-isopropylmalate/(R)-2-methylmalate dehydratase small subunit
MRITGRTWVLGDHVDTDALFPGKALRLPVEEAARYVLNGIRPGWVDEVREGDVLVGGRNFGIGSSRAVAPLLQHLGVRAILAEEFNSLFLRGCLNQGLLAVTVPGVGSAVREGDEVDVDSDAATVTNLRTGDVLPADRYPDILMRLVEAGGLLPALRAEGYLPAAVNGPATS